MLTRSRHPDTPTAPPAARVDRAAMDPTDPRGPVPVEPVRRDWRRTVISASGLNALIAAWMIAVPWVIYGTGDPDWNAFWIGSVVLLLGGARAAGAFRASWMSYLNALIGAWLFAAAFWLDTSTAAFWNDFACGAAIFLLGLSSASASDDALVEPATARWYRR